MLPRQVQSADMLICLEFVIADLGSYVASDLLKNFHSGCSSHPACSSHLNTRFIVQRHQKRSLGAVGDSWDCRSASQPTWKHLVRDRVCMSEEPGVKAIVKLSIANKMLTSERGCGSGVACKAQARSCDRIHFFRRRHTFVGRFAVLMSARTIEIR